MLEFARTVKLSVMVALPLMPVSGCFDWHPPSGAFGKGAQVITALLFV